jgi:hypothetical protein
VVLPRLGKNMNQTIDPTIKALVSAIGQAETGTSSPEAYTKRGASGEYGRYQFTPNTWTQYAKEAGVSSTLEGASIEDQNKVAYNKIAQWKAQGYNPAQIASMWNAGPDDPDAYKGTFSNGLPSVGVNSKGVAYNVPEYTRKVSEAYMRLKGQTGVVPQGAPQMPAQPEQPKGFLGDVGESFATVGNRLATAAGKTFSGEINPISGLIQGAGALGGGIGDLTTNVLEHTPVVKTVYKGLVDKVISPVVQGFSESESGQQLIGKYQKWAEKHPEAADNVSSTVDIVSAIPIAKGLSVAKNTAKGGIRTALHGSKNAIYEAVEPKLGPKGLAKAIAERGVVKKGLLRETQLAPDKFVQNIADTVKNNVPKFNPSRPFVDNIDEVQKVVTTMKNKLKTEVKKVAGKKTYSKRELVARLKKIEIPDLIASDATLKNAYKLLIKRVKGLVGPNKTGKVADLLDLRQDFDRMVRQRFGDIYKSQNLTPMRQAVGDIRDAITDFTVKKLPDGFGFKESLLDQHKLIKAIENMAVKAATGQTKEIGKNILTDKFKKTRGLVKMGTKAAIEGSGIGAMIKILD